jgi:predicted transcriptional regulator
VILSMKILAYLAGGNHGVVTPTSLGQEMGTTWQAAASRMRVLERNGLVKIRHYGKQTSYEITDRGRAEVAELTGE